MLVKLPCAKPDFAQWLSITNSYGEFHDKLKSGLITVIRFRETDREVGREEDHKAIYSFIYHLSPVWYVWITWPSQSKHKIEKKSHQTHHKILHKCLSTNPIRITEMQKI